MAVTNVAVTTSTVLQAERFGHSNFSTARNDNTAFLVLDDPDVTTRMVFMYKNNLFSAIQYNWTAHCLLFDTSAISTTITGLNLKLFGRTVSTTNEFGGSSDGGGDAIILEGTFGTTVATGDMDSFTGYTSEWDDNDVTEYSSAFGPAAGSWNTSAYNVIALNSDAITAANAGTLKCYIGNKTVWYDNDNLFTSNPEYHSINFRADKDGINPPILEVTHADPVSIPISKSITIGRGGTGDGISALNIKGGKLKVN